MINPCKSLSYIALVTDMLPFHAAAFRNVLGFPLLSDLRRREAWTTARFICYIFLLNGLYVNGCCTPDYLQPDKVPWFCPLRQILLQAAASQACTRMH